jgi:single-strand DNA-binding protein
MNKAILIGNLANDPELRTTQSGKAVCQFRLAIQRRFANAQGVREADFLPVVVWGSHAEPCARYLAKGRKCAVVGWLQTRSYDAQDGSKRYVTEVVADEVEFLGSKQESNAQPEAPAAHTAQFTETEDEPLPF